MKRKKSLISVLLLAVWVFVYIEISSTQIDKSTYRILAWEAVNHSSTVIDWKQANVSLVKLKDNPFTKQCIGSDLRM